MSHKEFDELENELNRIHYVSLFCEERNEYLRKVFPKEAEKLINIRNAWFYSQGYVNKHGILFLKLVEKLTYKYNLWKD